MRAAVLAYLPTFFYAGHPPDGGFEGKVNWMYLDIEGYITTGVGNLIDSPYAASRLPWKHSDGSLASYGEVASEWVSLDNHRTQPKGTEQQGSVAMSGGASGAMQALTTLRLSNQDVQDLFLSEMQSYEATIKSYFPGYDGWPADAQMFALAFGWAMGPNFATKWPSLTAHLRAGDFVAAEGESHSSSLRPARQAAHTKLLLNSAGVVSSGADPDRLYYPGDVSGGSSFPPPWVGPVAGLVIGVGIAAWVVWRV
jgi:hypothetical protein